MLMIAACIYVQSSYWDYNAGQLHVNCKYGFGRVDANASVALAKTWPGVSEQIVHSAPPYNVDGSLEAFEYYQMNYRVDAFPDNIRIEHVVVHDLFLYSDWSFVR